MNALKTGIHAKSLVLPTEKLADLEQLIGEYYQRHHPATPEARALVDDLVYGEWLKRRLRVAETQLWVYDHQQSCRPHDKLPLGQTAASRGKSFAQLQWRMECTRRATERAIQDLKLLEAEPEAPAPEPPDPEPPSLPSSPETTSPEIGFVLETPSAAPLQPAPEPYTDPTRPEPQGRDFPLPCLTR
jgi:hypothetical protein